MDNKTLNTVLTVAAFTISIVGLIICILIALGNEQIIGTAINLTLILMAIAGGTALVFGLIQFMGNIKKNMPTLIAVIVFVVLGFICYSLASDEVLRTYEDGITPSASKWSETGLMVMYILIVVAVIAALVGEIGKLFK